MATWKPLPGNRGPPKHLQAGRLRTGAFQWPQ